MKLVREFDLPCQSFSVHHTAYWLAGVLAAALLEAEPWYEGSDGASLLPTSPVSRELIPSVGHNAGTMKGVMADRAVVSDPEIMNGTPCFQGTRVPFKNLIDYLEGGHALGEFLRQFPTVSREKAIQALEEAKDSLLARIA